MTNIHRQTATIEENNTSVVSSQENNISVVLIDSPAKELTLDEKIARTTEVIHSLLAQGIHLLVASSFGKDSSVMLNIFLLAIKSFVAIHGKAPECRVVNSNTLVENPLMDAYARLEAEKVARFCAAHGLPVGVDIVEPNLSNNYLVNCIGGRTIFIDASNDSKCSIMMKVDPINKHKRRVFKQYGKGAVVSLVGTRFDESAERAKKMAERGDSFFDVSVNEAGDRVLSPIADFTLDDIFSYIGRVRAERIECYSNYDDLVRIYRDANGGDCMVTVYVTGSASKQPCGARTGCFICARSRDRSMENMLESEDNSFMRPLNKFREYIIANQYDPARRNWLSRSLNDDGTVTIAPNAYSPAYCEDLLRIVLTIQMRENRLASSLGIEPRFTLLRLTDIIAIEVLWARYGYHTSAAAMKIFDEVVHQGIEMDMPDTITHYPRKAFPRFNTTVPFADEHFSSLASGLRDVEAIVADCERTVVKADGTIYSAVNTSAEFSVDEEGADLFFEYEYENYLSRYANKSFCPTQVFHYFMRLGTVSLSKGGHKENDRMLRMANQIHRRGIVGVLNDPEKLMAALAVQ
jgi:3'-phosphoadenosine 5'-phosphosulfate sulfotransferase (PAPS reductase)/FAD synthetase